MSLILRSGRNDHIIFNGLVNIITYIIEESKLISENMSIYEILPALDLT